MAGLDEFNPGTFRRAEIERTETQPAATRHLDALRVGGG
jgi:hypothetical protein